MIEIWKPITLSDGIYKDLYDISNLGRVRGRKHNLKQTISHDGYSYISLSNKISKKFKIHTLVMHEFIKPRPEGLQINHLDGNKLNNHINNLEYVTPQENAKHAAKLGLFGNRQGENNNLSKLTSSQVLKIRERYKSEGISQRELTKIYNVSRSQISAIITRKRWKHV